MKSGGVQLLLVSMMLAVFSEACGGPLSLFSTATPTSTSTHTPVPPTSTATLTATPLPTETPVPGPASLTGTILLGGASFSSTVALRTADDSFTKIASSGTDSDGVYRMEDLERGTYEMWVLITSKSEMISGCNDVAPPDDTWRMGIAFGDDKALTIENAWLSKALLLMENMPASSDLKAQGFFAVLPELEVRSGIENTMDVALICK